MYAWATDSMAWLEKRGLDGAFRPRGDRLVRVV